MGVVKSGQRILSFTVVSIRSSRHEFLADLDGLLAQRALQRGLLSLFAL